MTDMCMMSVLTAYGRDRVPGLSWTPGTWQQFKQIAQQVEVLDDALGEPECVDPEKEAWMADVEERLKALEAS